MSKKLKIIHLPTTVGGNPQGISKHLNLLGVDSQTWTLSQNVFGYPADKVIMNGKEGMLLTEVKKILALGYILRCNVAFLNFGTGLFTPYVPLNPTGKSAVKKTAIRIYNAYNTVMAYLEILLLRVFNVRIFIQYQGDDARQGDYSKKHFQITMANRVDGIYYFDASDEAKRKRIRFYEAAATKIYALNPDLLHVLPTRAEFLPYSHVNMAEWPVHYTQEADRPLRFGHAPSHRAAKGTEVFLEAFDKLKLLGYAFELVVIEGKSNAEAKEIYKTVDVVVDQLFSGWYGGLAVEVMALGKPVVVYLREGDLHFIPEQMRKDMPFFNAQPDTVFDVLKSIVEMPRVELLEVAKKSRRYVETWHNPLAIAERLKTDMEAAL
jgi:hypothetical protein